MQQAILTLFTQSPLHVGAGASVGIVDLTVTRERHSGYPLIPGSSLKGVLADLWSNDCDQQGKRCSDSDAELLFGKDNDPKNARAGKLLIGEGKLLAFPVRSAKKAFAWITCPLALARLARDRRLSLDLPDLSEEQILAPESLALDGNVVLEEYYLQRTDAVAEPILAACRDLSQDSLWQQEMPGHLAVVANEIFAYFVQNACEIAQHIKIDSGTVKNGALFNQENVPSECLFYSVLHAPQADLFAKLSTKLQENDCVLQIGADATTGLGWCTASLNQNNA
ncbi:MAG: type III-B CRISPR module RAMP protein Cmr4 [Oligosphaeraceae bacterium]|nr:type III-B CRISPR module RAMP protein Cmr4 [Oligosphaeraceae bacterium]